MNKYARYSWIVVAYNLFVIMFGAFVRATGSGAGCGAHWPLCNGVVIPRPERIETIIEFTHRVTSGITLVLVAVLVVWAWRRFRPGSYIRKAAAAGVFFTITEALVGAGLVLFGLVDQNDSIARALAMVVHLLNTLLLIGALALNAWWATVGEPRSASPRGLAGVLLLLGIAGLMLLVSSGAITALGDTLYPSSSLAQGIADDFSSEAHYLIQLRVYHPAIAILIGIYLALVTGWVRRKFTGGRLDAITLALYGFYALQIMLGVVNVALLAPVWMQMVHLLASNLVWVTYVLMTAEVFGRLAPGAVHQTVHKPVESAAR